MLVTLPHPVPYSRPPRVETSRVSEATGEGVHVLSDVSAQEERLRVALQRGIDSPLVHDFDSEAFLQRCHEEFVQGHA